MINAIIPIWKPVDWTSFDVVKKIRAQIKPSKVGHAGTLDPFAEGVLMLCTGEFTKKVEFPGKIISRKQENIKSCKNTLLPHLVARAGAPFPHFPEIMVKFTKFHQSLVNY